MSTIRPLGTKLLVSPALSPKEINGIALPQSIADQYNISDMRLFHVIATGPKCSGIVSPNDRVLCHSYTTGPIDLEDGSGRKFITIDQVIAVVGKQ